MGSIGRLGGVAALLALAAGCLPLLPEVEDPCATWPEPGTYRIPVPGFDRTPTILVPATEGPRTALVALHGAGATGDAIAQGAPELAALVDETQVVGVFPNGSGTPAGYYWNAGSCCGVATAIGADDLGFLEALGAEVRRRVCVDHLVVAGHSNGGMMAMRWTCEGEQPDAVVSSAGPLLTGSCTGDPVPVVALHGTADTVVPLEGGTGSAAGLVDYPAARVAMARVAERNGCTGEPVEERVGAATCLSWDCPVDTRLCTLADWPHRWPGGRSGGPEGLTGDDVVIELLEPPTSPVDVGG